MVDRVRALERRLPLLLAALFAWTAAYFWNGCFWAQNARLDPILAFVEPGPHRLTFRIDGFLPDVERSWNTGDWARSPSDGHYYSNKAPGVILAGVPVYALLYGLERAVGVDPAALRPAVLNAWLLNLALSVIPVALALPVFHRVCRGPFGCDPARAGLLTALLGFGTLLLPYSTQLWGHPTAAACEVFALGALLSGRPRGPFLAGLWSGLATLCDYAAGPVALLLVGLAGWRSGRRSALEVALGGAGPALAMFAYHAWCFGDPFTLASSHSNPLFLREGRVGGLFGGVAPGVLRDLLLSWQHGLLVYMPALALAPWAAVHGARGPRRELLLLCGAAALLLLLLHGTFAGWHGGNAFGPRYQIVALPWYVLLLAFLPRRPAVGAALTALLAWSVAVMLAACLIGPCFRRPDLRTSALGATLRRSVAFARGEELVRLRWYPALPPRTFVAADAGGMEELARLTVWNLGEKLGLAGRASLLPLVAGWAAIALAFAARPRR